MIQKAGWLMMLRCWTKLTTLEPQKDECCMQSGKEGRIQAEPGRFIRFFQRGQICPQTETSPPGGASR